jgi:hypothetical protein|nr:MAG TPA: hypothetical protein [Caudoviricetes sp.]
MSTNNNQVTERFRINVTKGRPFNATEESTIISVPFVASALNAVMQQAYADYVGCNFIPMASNSVIQSDNGVILPRPGGMIAMPVLMFKVLSNAEYMSADKDFAFKPSDLIKSESTTQSSAKSFLTEYERRTSGKLGTRQVVELTKEGKEGLSEFISREHKNRNGEVKFDGLYTISGRNSFDMKSEMIITLRGIDIISIFSKIVFADSSNTSPLQYNIEVSTPDKQGITQQQLLNNNAPTEWLFTVRRIVVDNLMKVCEEIGYNVNITSSIPMYRANGR